MEKIIYRPGEQYFQSTYQIKNSPKIYLKKIKKISNSKKRKQSNNKNLNRHLTKGDIWKNKYVKADQHLSLGKCKFKLPWDMPILEFLKTCWQYWDKELSGPVAGRANRYSDSGKQLGNFLHHETYTYHMTQKSYP